ncbi:filamentous hemagglutinin family outer membrane protein [Kalymmatonema gypsitolerans NIES-4073]|nr:filamentous hemagglutinin family outer membrane protein [Scytonema sp. NIES-4073]
MSKMATRSDALLGIAIGKATALWVIAGVYTLSANCVLAQITPDATLPNNSIVNINGNTFNITGGTQAGANLFHSFQEFSVRTGSQAFFNNTVDIQNIISRVTGRSISNIDGLIRTLGTANLFLINPNGIVFGPNARLEIGGSFFASTASSLKFADGFEFRTDGTQTTPLLTITVPLGLQFGQNPGKIEVQGDGQGRRLRKTDLIDTPKALRLGANQTLGLVGGDLEFLGGTLKSTGGRIELGSVGSDSLVGLVPVANGWTLDYGGVQNFRDIQLLQGATVDASGIGGGNVRVQGRQITLKQGSRIEASNLGLGFQSGGTLEVTAIESIQLDGSEGTYGTTLFTSVYPGANGNAGNIQIRADSLSLTSGAAGATLFTSSNGKGDAGNVIIDARGNVSFNGGNAFTSVDSDAEGKGGNIQIRADSLSLTSGAAGATLFTSSNGKGDAGNVIIDARGNVSFDRSFASTSVGSDGEGKGGNIQIRADSLSLTNNASVFASTFGRGDAGNVIIDVRGNVSFDRSSASTSVGSDAEGKGGNIQIRADSLSLTNGSSLFADTFGRGDSGNVIIDVRGNVSFDRSSASTSVGSNGEGKGGNIQITADSLSLTNNAYLGADTLGRGDAGNIEVTAPQIRLDNRASFSAESASGNGGNINLRVGDLLLLRRGSLISATAGTDKLGGNGGNITINAPSGFIVSAPNENSDITANAFNGSGGKININSLGIFNFTQRNREDLVRELGTNNPNQLNPQDLPTNDITAFSLTNPNLSGQVTINTPDADQSLGLVELPIVLPDTSKFIANTGCAAIAATDSDTDKSKFTITGRGGLPPNPYEPLSTDVLWLDTRLSAITT